MSETKWQARQRSCTSVLVGRTSTMDGSIYIARNEDNSTPTAPKSLRMVPANEATYTLTSGASGFSIELPAGGMRYSAMPDVTPEDGLFEEAGINAAHVAMSATESAAANERVLAADPYVENGIAEDAMLTAVLPFVRTAREGVARLADIVAACGSAESNGVLFADHTEAWYMEIATGHHWVAQRIPDDCVAVVANQLSIQDVRFDSDDFMASEGIREFVQENALNPHPGTFDFRKIFGTSSAGDRRYNTPRVWDGMRLLAPNLAENYALDSDDMPFVFRPERALGVVDVAAVLSSHFDETDFDPIGTAGDAFTRTRYRAISLSRTQESHVLELSGICGLSAEACAEEALAGKLASPVCWVALGTPSFSPYMPLFTDAPTWPAEFDNATPKPSIDHAYWVFRGLESASDVRASLTRMRVEDYKGEQWEKGLAHAAKTKKQAAVATPENKLAIYEEANQRCANAAIADARAQLSQLLLDLSVASPLTFTMNPKL